MLTGSAPESPARQEDRAHLAEPEYNGARAIARLSIVT